ncbi:uncharacterized protein NMK_1756 [Novimethylophilus kurashikiensis]|uniref:Transmembrane protein n=1 Tax=Novimethylophilus kurashikiensis TaxID=1825523 RepID=A0A2R5F7I1_9PROT|nr:BPSS1780 family membrane protein [Novimethylophilus kurashikiensis]GBG14192.1 uncharacterized protein NMK_1756 [Novimethylophilus kurashikiensis]
MEVKKVTASHGWQWIRGGFDLFRMNPVIWITLFFVYLLLGMVLSLVPPVGPIILNLLAPVFMAGFMLGCQALESGEELEINHLFAGFKQNTSQLITVGGLYLVGIIVVAGLVFVTTGGTVMSEGLHDMANQHETPEASGGMLLAALLALALLIPLVMAYWFAPTLVIFHGMSAVEAMKLSFNACLNNLGAFTLYGLISMVLFILAAIPLGLGLLVMIPTLTASLYVSYKDIFAQEAVA